MIWYWAGGGLHWWGWFVGFVLTIGFWALLIVLVISLFRSISTKGRPHRFTDDGEDPERALARRFANGEIDEEEFHRRLDILRSHGLARKP